ncbi:hypothetical protein TNCV_1314901 [Trichonephila clavipes]|uniref:Uncharacterized protein n=1 Tax=Trichonephila clavipes TaxID=2585209 RepID=A0A8X6SU28_TRICX|nr:hypothetical protein TNCV_1314901 [Trichonephila clavipes]
MFDPSSFTDPTPLAHADTSRDVLPRRGTSQPVSLDNCWGYAKPEFSGSYSSNFFYALYILSMGSLPCWIEC